MALEEGKCRLEGRIREVFGRREFKAARALANKLEELNRDIERLYRKWS